MEKGQDFFRLFFPPDLVVEQKFFPVSRPDEVGIVPRMAARVHLTNQTVVNKEVVGQILRRCPGLEVLRTSPSLEHLARDGIRKMLEDRAVEFWVGRL